MKTIALLVLFLHFFTAYAHQSYGCVSKKIESLIEQVKAKQLDIPDALLAIDEKEIDILIKPSVIDPGEVEPIAEALSLCTGAAHGVLCFDLNELSNLKKKHPAVIWVADHIRNDDLCHLKDISAIFSLKEDPSSHAVIVARVFDIPFITLPAGVEKKGNALLTSHGTFHEGDFVTLDAFNGRLFPGLLALNTPKDSILLDQIMSWAESLARLEIHGNADTPGEAKEALRYGARGIDPRSEHMFFQPERLHLFRKVILSDGKSEEILEELKELQRSDFIELYQTMKSYPVKIRLLDPPLHEFLPSQEAALLALAEELRISPSSLKQKVDELQEVNPMMGHRGVRLLLTHPEILKMQAAAIFEAVIDPSLEEFQIEPCITIPMIIDEREVLLAKKWIDEVRDNIYEKSGKKIVYHFGVMIETPRACLLAETIAPHVDFISFGTNDLTAQTLAFSRGDVYEKFLKYYFENNLLPCDPFSSLDSAVCQLMKITIQKMRLEKHPISVGLCGEQGGGKAGVFMCNELGLNTVSCSPSRIPSVKLFAAQAEILLQRKLKECQK